ncbi:MAG: OsmC family protein [Spirochaetales bacterium]|nr:OsmC family protein [Spirochaetales bacterium]
MNTNQLSAKIRLKDSHVQFECVVEGQQPVMVDYFPPLGNRKGSTSLELLLFSLSSCLGTTFCAVARGRMKKQIDSLVIHSEGDRKEGHPASFKTIRLFLRIDSPDMNAEEAASVLSAAEESLCPVADMIRGNVVLEMQYQVGTGPLIML